MQSDQKLKKAMEEIKKILSEHDVAALVILHTPGQAEFLMKIDPSYSCAKFEGEFVRIRARLQEDFNGDKAAWEKKIGATSNMLHLLAETAGNNSISLFKLSDLLDKKANATHY